MVVELKSRNSESWFDSRNTLTFTGVTEARAKMIDAMLEQHFEALLDERANSAEAVGLIERALSALKGGRR